MENPIVVAKSNSLLLLATGAGKKTKGSTGGESCLQIFNSIQIQLHSWLAKVFRVKSGFSDSISSSCRILVWLG